ncbi:MAG: GAF domain-containing protein [Cyanophyceae cyanobacterium]
MDNHHNSQPALKNLKSVAAAAHFTGESAESEPQNRHEQTSASERSAATSTMQRSPWAVPASNSPRRQWSLRKKATAWALAVSTLPVLVVGSVFYVSSQSIEQQIEQAEPTALDWQETEFALQQQLFLLLLGTGATATLAGVVALLLVYRTLRPVLDAAEASAKTVKRLRQSQSSTRSADELATLTTNTHLVEAQLTELLKQQNQAAERSQLVLELTRRIWESLSEENVLKTIVDEVRKALHTERVVILRLDTNTGTFIAESAVPGLPKIGTRTIQIPYSTAEIEQYRQGKILVVDNVAQLSISEEEHEALHQLAVQASLSAPIFKNNQLFGLLMAHHCSEPRFWQQLDIDLLAQVASQAGFALTYAQVLGRVDAEANRAQLFIQIARSIRESLYEDEILKTTVIEVRKALRADRAIVYEFDENWYGTVVAESVLPGWPKALQASIKDPCFAEGYIDEYQNGRVHALNNIYEANLTECYLRQLEPFAVKANLVAPILKGNQLFGLLIAHQCSWPRNWQQSEIDFFAQIASQVGFALDQARLLQRVDTQGARSQMFSSIIRHIRASLVEADILKTTVGEVRKALRTDRVIVYEFDEDWYGTVVAEAVLPGWPKALQRHLKDPCFEEGYVEKYRAGRVHAISNIYEANLTECYLGQLEPLAVKANLVAPILKDARLFGLLIAHQCSGPRSWQQTDIDLFAQVATQVGFALDHARLLAQVQQACDLAQADSHQQRQQKETLARQVTQLLHRSEAAMTGIADEAAGQMELVTTVYSQMREVMDAVREAIALTRQADSQNEQLAQLLRPGQETLSLALEDLGGIHRTADEAADRAEDLDPLLQKLAQMVPLVSSITSQLKLHATNASLEAARLGENGEEFSAIAQKIIALTRQLNTNIAQIDPRITEIRSENQAVVAAMRAGTQQAVAGTRSVEETKHKLTQLVAISDHLSLLLEQVTQSATLGEQTASVANRSLLEVADVAKQLSESSVAVTQSYSQLASTQLP